MPDVFQADEGSTYFEVVVRYAVTDHREVRHIVRASTATMAESGGYTATRDEVPGAYAMSATVTKLEQVPHVVLEENADGDPSKVAFAMTPTVVQMDSGLVTYSQVTP